MMRSRWITLALALALGGTACSEGPAGGSRTVIGPDDRTPTTELRGFLQMAETGDVSLLWAGREIALIGVTAAVAADHAGHEVVVSGQWQGDAFRVFTVQAAEVTTPEEPQLRIP